MYKIVKKYDKVMHERTLPEWLAVVDAEEFVTSQEPSALIDVVTSLVSRDKLMEWQHKEQQGQDDLVCPAVQPLPLAVSALCFVLSFQCPPIDPGNPHANRCFSLLVLAVCLWLSNAIPYFATALLIPVLITSMEVLRNEEDPSAPLPPEVSAKYVLNHFFNHTTVSVALAPPFHPHPCPHALAARCCCSGGTRCRAPSPAASSSCAQPRGCRSV